MGGRPGRGPSAYGHSRRCGIASPRVSTKPTPPNASGRGRFRARLQEAAHRLEQGTPLLGLELKVSCVPVLRVPNQRLGTLSDLDTVFRSIAV